MKKILTSVAVLAFVGAAVVGATTAYFSDTETSSGNTFTAGSIDLKIDNECHWSGEGVCPWHNVVGPDGKTMLANWTENDLENGVHKFFYFTDLKPGDRGEDTISLHIVNNDAWGRFYWSTVSDMDNDCTEPEGKDELGGSGGTEGCTADGELDDEIEAMVWLDQGLTPGFQGKAVYDVEGVLISGDGGEGDNFWQSPMYEPIIHMGKIANISYDPTRSALADALSSVYKPGESYPGINEDGHMTGSITYYIGLMWCFGTAEGLVPSPGNPVICNGLNVDNTSQTDSFSGNLTFEVKQYRNNPNPWTP